MRSSKRLSEAIGKWRKRRKGYFAVYAREGKRFVVPLYYLNHPIFKVLLEMAEEEFGLAAQGPLQVPCEEELMDHIVSLIRDKKPQVGEERALVSISSCRAGSVFSSLSVLQFRNQDVFYFMFENQQIDIKCILV
ncbi:hypothetical protein Sjap_017459 [Stephania japonica]|uniref:Small auxin up regulated protein n=1 Tax=Stephania japonica TaxID=461633 RepID=A0AAP0I675_9MAGN